MRQPLQRIVCLIGSPRACRVSFVGRDGIEHAAQVVACTRNEAAIRALAQFRQNEFAEMNGPYQEDTLTVEVMSVESHQVTVAEAKAWLERHGTPREMQLRQELKQLFPPVNVRRRKTPAR